MVLFRELMLAHMIDHYGRVGAPDDPVFFDRGIPGLIGYCRLIGVPVPDHIRRAAEVFRYNDTVFVTPPWPEIYAQDHERHQDFAEAVRTYEVVVEGIPRGRLHAARAAEGQRRRTRRFRAGGDQGAGRKTGVTRVSARPMPDPCRAR